MSDPRDSKIDELFNRLKQIEPPVRTRIAIREAVAAELEKLGDGEPATRRAVWQRSISVPIPVVAASVALILTFAALSFLPNDQATTLVDRDDQTVNDNVVSLPNDGGENGGTNSSPLPSPEPFATMQSAYHESSVYLCGIGQLRTESRHFFEE